MTRATPLPEDEAGLLDIPGFLKRNVAAADTLATRSSATRQWTMPSSTVYDERRAKKAKRQHQQDVKEALIVVRLDTRQAIEDGHNTFGKIKKHMGDRFEDDKAIRRTINHLKRTKRIAKASARTYKVI